MTDTDNPFKGVYNVKPKGARKNNSAFVDRPTIGSGDGDCAPAPSHTTGRAVFRIRRLKQAL